MKRALTVACLCALTLGSPLISASADPPSKMQQAKAKESKADQDAAVAASRDAIQSLEHTKKVLEAVTVKDSNGHRAKAITLIQQAMGEIRAQTSKPGH